MDIGIKTAEVIEVIFSDEHISKVLVKLQDKMYKAINYNALSGALSVGDKVIINTTAIDLNLGTGGYHFVLSNLNSINKNITGEGHIMKLRYTPLQLKVLSAEEQCSPFHDKFNNFESLDGMPVIIGTLHSMVTPTVNVIKELNRNLKVAYIMTDGAALPLAFSDAIRNLKKDKKLSGTITVGNAFGGDLECVNIYNGLIAAKEILECDIAIVTMGPGITGTDTKYGFTGIEQSYIIDAVNTIRGFPIAIPRISFTDSRKRHYGISHHSLTVLKHITKTKANIGIPYFEEEKRRHIMLQITSDLLNEVHNIIELDIVVTNRVSNILENYSDQMSTMGRNFLDDKEFFITSGIAGYLAAKNLCGHL